MLKALHPAGPSNLPPVRGGCGSSGISYGNDWCSLLDLRSIVFQRLLANRSSKPVLGGLSIPFNRRPRWDLFLLPPTC